MNTIQGLIWKKGLSGQMLFKRKGADLQLVLANEQAIRYFGSLIKQGELLCEKLPSHLREVKGYNKPLIDIYLSVLKSGKEKEINFEYSGEVSGWFKNRIFPLINEYLYMDFVDITEIQNAAIKDPLSGLYNRYYLETYISNSQGVIYCDIDNFKRINDNLGHASGDEIIRRLSLVISGIAKVGGGYGFRIGGDEFLIVYEKITHAFLDHLAADLFYQALNIKELGISTPCSIGTAYSAFPENNDILVERADYACRLSKQYKHSNQIADRVRTWGNTLEKKRTREQEVKRALDKRLWENEFWLAYQVIVDLESMKVAGAEALLRWDSAKIQNLNPDEFIPLAETSPIIHEVGQWVIREVVLRLAQVPPSFSDFWISINVSPMEIEYGSVSTVLASHRGKNIAIEITERGLVKDQSVFSLNMKKIKSAKISLKIDDFGTGTAGLQQLISFPFDTLKIDRGFVPRSKQDGNRIKICKAVAALATEMGFDVIVEGIETQEQLDFFKSLNCKYGQGYFFGKPINWETFKSQYLLDILPH